LYILFKKLILDILKTKLIHQCIKLYELNLMIHIIFVYA